MTLSMITIKTMSFDDMVSFYEDKLELSVKERGRDYVIFDIGLEIIKGRNTSNVDLFFETFALDSIISRLDDLHISIGSNGERVASTEDSDGNNIVIRELRETLSKPREMTISRI